MSFIIFIEERVEIFSFQIGNSLSDLVYKRRFLHLPNHCNINLCNKMVKRIVSYKEFWRLRFYRCSLAHKRFRIHGTLLPGINVTSKSIHSGYFKLFYLFFLQVNEFLLGRATKK